MTLWQSMRILLSILVTYAKVSHGSAKTANVLKVFAQRLGKTMKEFVEALARGEGNFYDGWMKNPYSAMISCNDGFRPVSFYIETIE